LRRGFVTRAIRAGIPHVLPLKPQLVIER
jgi:hypothetical protein